MLLVITGAGASYDSSPSFPGDGGMPLGDQLFQNREDFVSFMPLLPRLLPIAGVLQKRAEDGISVERTLEEYQAEAARYPIRHRQLAAVRFYLQLVIGHAEDRWQERLHGITNYKSLLDQIESWRRPSERVVLATFNYDAMLEKDLLSVGCQIKGLEDYISDSRYQLIKLHGSRDWGREVDTPIEEMAKMTSWQLANALIERAEELSISDRYRISNERPLSRLGTIALFPAAAVPFETKRSFECPPEHLDALQAFLPSVTRVLVVGWRGAEQHFLKLLATGLRSDVRFLVVAGGERQAKATISRMQDANVPGDYFNTEGGFTDLVVNRRANEFLKTS